MYDRIYLESQVLAAMRVAYSTKEESLAADSQKVHAAARAVCGLQQNVGPRRRARKKMDPAADLRELATYMKTLETWRHKRLAHIERDFKLPELEWDELDAAVVGVGDLFARCAWRVTGVNYQVWVDDAPPWTNLEKRFHVAAFQRGRHARADTPVRIERSCKRTCTVLVVGLLSLCP